MKNQFQYASYYNCDTIDVEKGCVRLESMCKLVGFSEAIIDESINYLFNTLDLHVFLSKAGLKWTSRISQSSLSALIRCKKYPAKVITYGVVELKRQLMQLIKMTAKDPQAPFPSDKTDLYDGFNAPAMALPPICHQGAPYRNRHMVGLLCKPNRDIYSYLLGSKLKDAPSVYKRSIGEMNRKHIPFTTEAFVNSNFIQYSTLAKDGNR